MKIKACRRRKVVEQIQSTSPFIFSRVYISSPLKLYIFDFIPISMVFRYLKRFYNWVVQSMVKSLITLPIDSSPEPHTFVPTYPWHKQFFALGALQNILPLNIQDIWAALHSTGAKRGFCVYKVFNEAIHKIQCSKILSPVSQLDQLSVYGMSGGRVTPTEPWNNTDTYVDILCCSQRPRPHASIITLEYCNGYVGTLPNLGNSRVLRRVWG